MLARAAQNAAPDRCHPDRPFNAAILSKWKAAAEAWSKARTRARNQTEEFYTWLNEARAWIEHGDTKRAEPCLQSALAILPDSGVALGLLEKIQNKED